jgi:polysaccharide deacetylase 2 family uncharacterized protein YibQ
MGSKLTAQSKQMKWVMQTLAERDLYFIDSLTNSESVAFKTARRHGLQTLQRDIFLDHEIDHRAIQKAMEKAIKRARNNGYAIAIGHPYRQTLDILEHYLPTLQARNIELVPVSQLVGFHKQQASNSSQKNTPAALKR